MQESDFEFDRASVAVSSQRFPAHRKTVPVGHPDADVSYLQACAEFGRHAWDEGGHS